LILLWEQLGCCQIVAVRLPDKPAHALWVAAIREVTKARDNGLVPTRRAADVDSVIFGVGDEAAIRRPCDGT
jgi:hypothetical protein